MNKIGHRLLHCCMSCVALLSFLRETRAQSDGPIVIRQAERPPMFYLERPTAKLQVEGTYTRSTTSDVLEKTEFQDFRIDETLALATKGHFVHPSVFLMNLKGNFGLSQLWSNGGDSIDRQDGTIYEYDTRFVFFEPRPLSAAVYAKRDRTIIDRSFGPTVEETTDTYGAASDLRLSSYNSHLEAFHTTSQLRSRGDTLQNFDYREDTVIWTNRYQLSINQELTWDYTFSDSEQNAVDFGSHTQRQDARVQHLWRFGESNRSSLTSILTLNDQSGTYDQQYLRWEERLRLHHSQAFETNYRWLYDVRESRGIQWTKYRGTAGFTHRLYDSLVTVGEVGGEKSDAEDNPGESEYFGSIDFNYRKSVPLGTLTAGLGLGYNYRDTAEGATRPPVDNLPFSVADNQVGIVLIDPQLNPDSIVITDPTGLRLYRLGIDYDLVERGQSVEIRPILGGSLTPGTTVLVDYAFDPVPANTTTTNRVSLTARYAIERGALKGLSFYGRYFQQDQSFDTNDPALFIGNSFQDSLVGIEYRFLDFTVTAEQEWRTGDVYPFDATRFSAKWETLIFDDTAFLLNSSYYMFEYPDEDNHVDLWTISAQIRQRLFERCTMSATALWRDEQDDLFGHSSAFDQQLEFDWEFRQFTFFLRARNTFQDNEERDSSFQEVHIGIQREF